MKMRAVIVDDELTAIKVLTSLLADYEDIQVVGRYTDPHEALDHYRQDRPDVIFLDIEMGKLDGLAAADLFNNEAFVPIVFVTAYSQYALDAFEANAMDYLLKPVQKRRLTRTIEKLKALRSEKADEFEALPAEKEIQVISLDLPTVTNERGDPVQWRTRKAKELFYYLWLNRQQPVNKEIILERLFPDREEAKALALLHTTVYQVRSSLASLGFPESIKYANESYQLRIPVTSDLDQVYRILNSDRGEREEVRQLMAYYRKDFLEEEDYAWTLGFKLRLKNQVLRFMEKVIGEEVARGQSTPFLLECLDFLRLINPLGEQTARLFLDHFALQNKKAEMKEYFATFRQRLAKEMKLRPSQDLEDYYRVLLDK